MQTYRLVLPPGLEAAAQEAPGGPQQLSYRCCRSCRCQAGRGTASGSTPGNQGPQGMEIWLRPGGTGGQTGPSLVTHCSLIRGTGVPDTGARCREEAPGLRNSLGTCAGPGPRGAGLRVWSRVGQGRPIPCPPRPGFQLAFFSLSQTSYPDSDFITGGK